jgi:hypothetical protein
MPEWKPIGTYRSCPLPKKLVEFPYTKHPPLTQEQITKLVNRLYPGGNKSPAPPCSTAARAENSANAS